MQIDFQKEVIHASELRGNQSTTLLVEGDVIVPDIKPDIKEILLTDARANLTEQKYSEGKLHVAGTVAVKILYIPDGEDANPKNIETKFDFKDVLEFAGEEGLELSGKAGVEHVDFSLINSRKMNMKIAVLVNVGGHARREVALLTGTGENSLLKVRQKPISTYQMVADQTAEVVVSEMLEIPGAKPDAEEVIKLDAKAFKGDCKIMSGKILLKGALAIRTLYSSVHKEDGIESMEHELPFSDMVDVEGLGDDCLCHVSYEIKDVFYSLRQDVNGDTRIVSLDVVLCAHIMASKTQTITVIDDCYSTAGKEEISRSKVHLDELLCEGVSHLNLKEVLAVPELAPAVGGIYSLDCKPKVTEIQVVDEKLVIRGKMVAVVLYGSAEESLPVRSLFGEFDFEHVVPVDGADANVFCECGVTDQNISFTLNAASEIELRCILEFYTRAVRKMELELVSGCEIDESEHETEKNRGLVIYFAQRGDTLWDVSKRYRTDKEAIMQLNRMEGELLLPGQKLLIPGN